MTKPDILNYLVLPLCISAYYIFFVSFFNVLGLSSPLQ